MKNMFSIKRFFTFLEDNLQPKMLHISFRPNELSLDYIRSQVEEIEYYHPFGNSRKFWNIQVSEDEITFQDQMKGSLMGKYRIRLDQPKGEAVLSVEYSKGKLRLYFGAIMFGLIGLFTGFGFGYFWIGLFFGSPCFYFLFKLRNAEQRNDRFAMKEAKIILVKMQEIPGAGGTAVPH